MSQAAGWPTRAKILIAAVILGGAAAVVARVPQIAQWTPNEVALCGLLIAAVAVGELFQMELPYRNEKVTFSVSDAIWTAGLFLLPPSVLAIGFVLGVLAGQLVQPWALVKVAFNAGQFLIGINVAVLLFSAVGSPPVTEPAGWLAAAIAMAGFQVVNTVLMAGVISSIEREPFRSVALVQTRVLHWVGNLAIGVLGALLWVTDPVATPLLVVPLGISFLAYRGWLRSIEERDAMQAMAREADDLSRTGVATARLHLPPGQEDARALATTLNMMLDRLDAAFQRERLFIRETSHELRTPITICCGHLELLHPTPTAAELAETVDVVVDELARMARIVDDMNTLARMEDPASLRTEEIDIDVFLADVSTKAATLTDGRLQITSGPAAGRLTGDPQRLTQALINLLKNAVQHTPCDTKIELRALTADDRWRFEVTDHGDGVPPVEEESVFLPFCTGSSHTPGSGLGLAIVSGIARAHRGLAGLDNRPGSGATFWLEVPR